MKKLNAGQCFDMGKLIMEADGHLDAIRYSEGRNTVAGMSVEKHRRKLAAAMQDLHRLASNAKREKLSFLVAQTAVAIGHGEFSKAGSNLVEIANQGFLICYRKK